MPYWGWILLIVGLGLFAVAIVAAVLNLTHRRMHVRQAAQGDPETDISAPLPMDVAKADDAMESGHAMTAREIEEERQREAQPRARNRAATYELAFSGLPAGTPIDVAADVPPAEIGEVLFHNGHFWRVDAIEPAQSQTADGRLIVSQTTGEPKPRTGRPSR